MKRGRGASRDEAGDGGEDKWGGQWYGWRRGGEGEKEGAEECRRGPGGLISYT